MKGETVILLNETKASVDPFGNPINTTVEITVNDVLIGSPSTNEVTNDLNMYGKKLAFTLGIPKTDKNDWSDKIVKIRGEKYKTYGAPLFQTPENVPGRWNTQIKVERYE